MSLADQIKANYEAWMNGGGFPEDAPQYLNAIHALVEASTPITPEALEAAGWKYHKDVWRRYRITPDCPVVISIDGIDWRISYWGESITFPNLKTMEQLHQLLEMMGVGQ